MKYNIRRWNSINLVAIFVDKGKEPVSRGRDRAREIARSGGQGYLVEWNKSHSCKLVS